MSEKIKHEFCCEFHRRIDARDPGTPGEPIPWCGRSGGPDIRYSIDMGIHLSQLQEQPVRLEHLFALAYHLERAYEEDEGYEPAERAWQHATQPKTLLPLLRELQARREKP